MGTGLRLYDQRHGEFVCHGRPRLLPAYADAAVPFDVSDIARWWYERRNTIDLREIGRIVPPFDVVWLEFTDPAANQWFALVRSDRHDDGEFGWSLRVVVGAQADDGSAPRSNGLAGLIRLDRDGRVVRKEYEDAPPPMSGMLSEHLYRMAEGQWQAYQNEVADALESCTGIAALALAFANVKNADVELEPERKLSNAQRRKLGGQTPRRFRRIFIPGTNKGPDGTATGGSRDTPVHLVRGHFKTYTAERPLFGKLIGTYWWSWHGRGDEQHGTVDHEYVVKTG